MLQHVLKAVGWTKTSHQDMSVQTSGVIDVNTFDSNFLDALKLVRSSHGDKQRQEVLIIDADAISVHVLELMLPEKDFEICYDKALLAIPCKDMVDRIIHHINPDLIILDASYHDSLPLLQGLRGMLPKYDLPILLTASSRYEQGIHKCLEQGANDFIYKPIRSQELLHRVNNLLQFTHYIRKTSILTDILPSDIIYDLENGRTCITKFHDDVTILFSDICSYTVLSTNVPTATVIHLLNTMFCGFDDICLAHGVYKVETIGDAYMIASGHDGKLDHVEKMVSVAKHMLEYVRGHSILGGMSVRIGIHTGPAHSGVIGKIRPRYCFFGDTVNTASRMESHGFPSSIHVSKAVFDKLLDKDSYQIQDRGNIDIKGKGTMHTYVLFVP